MPIIYRVLPGSLCRIRGLLAAIWGYHCRCHFHLPCSWCRCYSWKRAWCGCFLSRPSEPWRLHRSDVWLLRSGCHASGYQNRSIQSYVINRVGHKWKGKKKNKNKIKWKSIRLSRNYKTKNMDSISCVLEFPLDRLCYGIWFVLLRFVAFFLHLAASRFVCQWNVEAPKAFYFLIRPSPGVRRLGICCYSPVKEFLFFSRVLPSRAEPWLDATVFFFSSSSLLSLYAQDPVWHIWLHVHESV